MISGRTVGLFLPGGFSIVILYFCWQGLEPVPQKVVQKKEAFSWSNTQLLGIDGQEITGRGQKKPCTILHVWASWCPSCREDHQRLLTLKKQTACNVVGIINKEATERALAYLADAGNPYDSVGVSNPYAALEMGVTKMPLTILLDSEDVIVYREEGGLRHKFMEKHQAVQGEKRR